MDIISKNSEKLKILAIKYKLKVLILFGSYAKQTNNKNSDIDIACVPNKNFSTENYMKLRDELLEIFNIEKLDLIDLEKTHCNLIRKEMYVNGICLYEKDKGLFNKITLNYYMEYLDFKDNYKLREKIVEERLNALLED